jgi:glycosyltransferase involved in cell wall biosynthesis
MIPDRLRILCLSQLPPSPPRFGAQARMHGIMTHLARHHDVTAVSLLDDTFDAEECRRAMSTYCTDVVLVPNPRTAHGTGKRLLQLRSLASLRSFERLLFSVDALQPALDRVLRRQRFDVVNLEFPYLAHLDLRQSPPEMPAPPLVLDAHEVAYDLAGQIARSEGGLARRLYGEVNWRKLRREERAAFRTADGIYACSTADETRILADVPSAHTAVIPNAADVEYYQPRASDPPPDGRTILFFGLLSTVPNVDGIRFFVRDIWPRIAAQRPDARCRIIGARPHPSVLELARPGVEVVGFVEDLRPHLSAAAALVVPLRVGSGTRLKIVEGMAMGKPIVSTTLGAEGIDAVPERDILIADDPADFAASVIRVLDDPALGARLGRSARKLSVERYSWSAAASTLERFMEDVITDRMAKSRRTPHGGGQTAAHGAP